MEGLLEWLVMIPHPSREERSEKSMSVLPLEETKSSKSGSVHVLLPGKKCLFSIETQRTVLQLNRTKSKAVRGISESSVIC